MAPLSQEIPMPIPHRPRFLSRQTVVALVVAGSVVACGGEEVADDPTAPLIPPVSSTGSPRATPGATPVSSPGPSTPVSPTTDAATVVLYRASDRLGDLSSIHFDLDIDGTTYIDEGESIQILSAEGDIVRPDRVRASFSANVEQTANVTIQIVTIGPTTWWTNLVSGEWGPAPAEIGYDASVLFDEAVGLGAVLRQFGTVSRFDEEEFDGDPAYHIAATVPRTLIDAVTANTLDGELVDVDVWVGRDSVDILRVVVRETSATGADDLARWILDVTDHDEPVTIEPPV